MLTRKIISGLIFGMSVLTGNAFAQDSIQYIGQQQPGQQQNQRQQNGVSRVPPDSAISACSGKSEGTACVVTEPNGTKQGICTYTPDKKYYACKPNDMNMTGAQPQR